MKAIHQYLDMTPEDHEEFIQRLWLNWTENHAINITHWQNILASAAANRWFRLELDRAHQEFLKFVSRYDDPSTVTTVDFNACYRRCTAAIFEIFPKPIIEALKPKQKAVPKGIILPCKMGVIGPVNYN